MHPAATLFVDVCVQRDCWPDGPWPLVSTAEAAAVARLCALAAELGIRRCGIVCLHADGALGGAAEVPVHCMAGAIGSARPPDVSLPAPDPATDSASGCCASPDDAADTARAFDRATAGIRDAVVFGAGVEYGIARAVDALLRRRIRTHVALDAAGARDADVAQRLVAAWKRRGVDGATVATVRRLLDAGGRN
jgi:nicotinamidase-related amidase